MYHKEPRKERESEERREGRMEGRMAEGRKNRLKEESEKQQAIHFSCCLSVLNVSLSPMKIFSRDIGNSFRRSIFSSPHKI